MTYFTTQKDFFQKLDNKKYSSFENNLCWLINIFIILKNYWINISEKEIFQKALELNSFDKNFWWKYEWLIKLFDFYNNFLTNNFNSFKNIKIFDTRIFHNFRLKKIFNNFKNKIFIASVKFDENHLIIIEKIINNTIYYKSVWTKNKEAEKNWKIKINNFFEIYNKRGILIKKI